MTMREGFGIALGGGTARAFAHVGVLKVLAARGEAPVAVAGTSAGAILGAFYALGTTPDDIDRLVRRADVGQLWRQALDPTWGGLIGGRRLAEWLDRTYFHGASFADAVHPFAVACTDLASGALVVIREGAIAPAVVASSALPGFFAPARRADRVLVDGGFMQPVPFDALRSLGVMPMLGVHAGIDVERSRLIGAVRHAARSPWAEKLHRRPGEGVRLGTGAALAAGLALVATSYEHGVTAPEGAALVRVRPQVAWWDFHRIGVAIDAGERAMRLALESSSVAAVTASAGSRPVSA